MVVVVVGDTCVGAAGTSEHVCAVVVGTSVDYAVADVGVTVVVVDIRMITDIGLMFSFRLM